MYNGWQRGKAPSNEWIDGTTEFLNSAFSIPSIVENDTIKCLVHNVGTTLDTKDIL